MYATLHFLVFRSLVRFTYNSVQTVPFLAQKYINELYNLQNLNILFFSKTGKVTRVFFLHLRFCFLNQSNLKQLKLECVDWFLHAFKQNRRQVSQCHCASCSPYCQENWAFIPHKTIVELRIFSYCT